MVSEAISGKEQVPVIPLVFGGATGVLTFLSLCIWFGLPIVPNDSKLPSRFHDKPSPYAALAAPAGPTDPNEAAYQATCGACHQSTGKGLPGSFPPLAGSEWANGDPETPIRIVLMGLSGPITVEGQTYNSMMPPPPGLDDAKIAQILTFVRSSFGNKASKIETAQVAAVRASLAGRNKPWTVDELSALRKPGDAAGAGAKEQPAGAAPAAEAQPAATPAGAAGAPAAKPVKAPKADKAKAP